MVTHRLVRYRSKHSRSFSANVSKSEITKMVTLEKLVSVDRSCSWQWPGRLSLRRSQNGAYTAITEWNLCAGR
jgi:hypothetical protein